MLISVAAYCCAITFTVTVQNEENKFILINHFVVVINWFQVFFPTCQSTMYMLTDNHVSLIVSDNKMFIRCLSDEIENIHTILI